MKQKNSRWTVAFWLAIYLVSLLPIMILAKYSFACADDFGYSTYTRLAWVDTHNIFAVLAAAGKKVAESYLTWQGTYSSIFLMALQPGIWGEGFYWVTPWVMIGALSVSIFYVFRVIFVRLLGAEKEIAISAAAVYLLIAVQCMVDKTQGFFWYNGAVHYMVPQAMLFVLTGIVLEVIKRDGEESKGLLSVGVLLLLYLGGTNLVTGLECGIWIVTAIVLLYLAHRKRIARKLWILFIVWGVSYGINVAAPGNWLRQEEFSYRPGVIRSVLQSFYYCLEFVFDSWQNWTVLAFVLLSFPFVMKAVQNYKGTFSFRCPLLVPVYSYCILASMFTPSIYAGGGPGAGRIYNIIYLTFLLLIVVNMVYCYGWYWKKYGADKKVQEKDMRYYQAAVFGGTLFGIMLYAGVNPNSFTATSALKSLSTGEASAYRQQQEERLEILLDEDIPNAVLDEFTAQPYLLYYEDIEDFVENWKNLRMSSYFRKESVLLRRKTE